jgi:carbon monoxide dehydrogenase subunit G
MNLGSTFNVPVDGERVFQLFLDPDAMAACIPGCEELVRVDERNYSGRLVNEIAHVRFNASFSAEIVELDEPRLVRAVLKGEDRRLGSSLKLDASLSVQPNGNGSEVSYSMEMALWGKLGRMGESILRRRTAEVEKQFVETFTQLCLGVPIEQVGSGAKAAAAQPAAVIPEAHAPGQAPAAAAVAPAPAAAPLLPAAQQVPLRTAALAGLALVVLGWALGRCSARSGR